VLEQVVANNSFEKMRERERSGVYTVSYGERLTATNAQDEKSHKVRRGNVSGYRGHLSDADIAYCTNSSSDISIRPL
jgi:hypothetical protein